MVPRFALVCLLSVLAACASGSTAGAPTDESSDADTTAGDGDGDATTGDSTGDSDGDTTTGDGDGDGDGDPTGDGDGEMPDGGPDDDLPNDGVYTIFREDWVPGTPPPSRLPGVDVLPLGGGLTGPAIWVDNNPEKILGDGWTMQAARNDATRGGRPDPMNGTFLAYAFHVNGSATTRYYHILTTNPGASPATITARGAAYSNTDQPLGGPGTGPSYAVANAWRTNSFNVRTNPQTIDQGRGAELVRIAMPPGAMIDVRIEVTTDQPVFVYGVVTSTGTLNDSINGSQQAPANGDIAEPGPNRFGRQAGVYAESRWAGKTRLVVPGSEAHVGLAFNTNGKFALDGVTLQEQTALARTHLLDSSDRSYGNYGMAYQLELELRNPWPGRRRVRVSFASNVAGDLDSPSFTWSGPMVIDGASQVVFVTPRAPRQELAEFVLDPGEVRTVQLNALVPGLITAGSHLLFEADTVAP